MRDAIVFSLFDQIVEDDGGRGGLSEDESTERIEKRFIGSFSNLIKGLVWDKKTRSFTDTGNGLFNAPLSEVDADKWFGDAAGGVKSKKNTLAALSEAFTRLQSQDKTKLTKNPFLLENKTENSS